jgi:hypothetical protein
MPEVSKEDREKVSQAIDEALSASFLMEANYVKKRKKR